MELRSLVVPRSEFQFEASIEGQFDWGYDPVSSKRGELADMEDCERAEDAHRHPILSLFVLPKFQVWCQRTFRRLC